MEIVDSSTYVKCTLFQLLDKSVNLQVAKKALTFLRYTNGNSRF